MSEFEASTLLKLIGDLLKEYYLNVVFPSYIGIGIKNVKLLIDNQTFENFCNKAVNHKVVKDKNYTYQDCIEAFDCIGTKFKQYTGSLANNNYSIALAIAVYQVLISYDINLDDSNDLENGYHSQLKNHYTSIGNGNDISYYFSNQESLWETIKLVFPGYDLGIPVRRNNNYRYVQYPISQRIIEPKKFREACVKFEKLDLSKSYTIEDFKRLPDFYLYNKQYEIPLIYQAFLSWSKIDHSKSLINDNGTTSVEFVNFDGALYTDYGTVVSFDDYVDKPFYYYEEFGLWRNEQLPKDKAQLVGFIKRKKDQITFSDLYCEFIECCKEDFIFYVFELNKIRQTEIYKLFYRSTKTQNNDNQQVFFEIKNGVKLDGRNNSYDKEFLPDIKLLKDCKKILIKDIFGKQEFCVRNNIIRLSDYKDMLAKGEIVITFYDEDIPDLTLNIVVPERKKIDTDEFCIGWNLKTLAPSIKKDEIKLVGLYMRKV